MTHYRQTFTDLEIVEAGPHQHGIDQRLRALMDGSGVFNTNAGRLNKHREVERCVTDYTVTFDSRAWTG